MQKILFHINSFVRAGAERVVSTLAGQFAENGYEVVAATEWQDEHEYELDPRVRRVHVGLLPEDEGKSRIKKAALRISHFHKCLKKEQPDVVVAFTRKPIYRALLAGMGIKIPIVISVRNNPANTYNGTLDKLMIGLFFNGAAGGVFQTEVIKDFFPKRLKEKSTIILNPVNEKFMTHPAVTQRKKEIVCVNRLAEHKNQLLLAKAFVRLHKAYPDYILKFYGRAEEEAYAEKLREFIAANRAEDYIYMMGVSTQVEQDIFDASLFVLTSNKEGLPNVLMEAMALGLPVIATDCDGGGARVLIENEKNGLLIQKNDEGALQEAMERVLQNPEWADALGREAEKIRETAESRCIYRQWEAFLQGCCKG